MASAFSPSGFGSRWLSWENSTSVSAFRPTFVESWATTPDRTDTATAIERAKQRIAPIEANFVRAELHSRPSPAGVSGVFHGTAFRLDLGQAGAAFDFHDLVAQKR